MQDNPAPTLGDWALVPLWPEQLEELINCVQIAMADTSDFRVHQARKDLSDYLASHRPGPGADRDPEASEIERVWQSTWLPAFGGGPTLAKVKRELFRICGVASDRGG